MIVTPDFADHWKTELLASIAGSDAVLCLLRLWGQCQRRKSERFEDCEPIQLAAMARWKGEPEALQNALISAKLAERHGTAFVMRGWEEHNERLMTAFERGKRGGRPVIHGRRSRRNSGGNECKTAKKREGVKL